MPDDTKPLIGLTGGIASGKSTVARVLASLGIVVVDADLLAREVVAPGSDGLSEVVKAFGTGVLGPDGELARPKLAEVVFKDEDARKRLNAIVHPRIGQLSALRIAEAQRSASPYIVYEAPLLVETGAHRGMQALIVVAAPEELQRSRIGTRDGLSETEARDRLAAQLPLSAKVQAADYVIDNDADLAQLRERTLQTHRAILQRFNLPAEV
jgi:dephospho-CoA kinase